MTRRPKPVLGEAFKADPDNLSATIEGYLDEMAYYRPRGWMALVRASKEPGFDADGWIERAETLLTEWAQRVAGHTFIRFGAAEDNEVGFWIDAQDAIEQADECREWYIGTIWRRILYPKGSPASTSR